SQDARIGQPEVREGWVVQSMVPWLTGPQQAKLFMLSGDIISAGEAHRLGVVARVVPPGEAATAAIALAKRLSHVPAVAARAVKRMVNGLYDLKGIRTQQAEGIAVGAFTSHLSPVEKGTSELARIRKEQGLKASLKFRDDPFKECPRPPRGWAPQPRALGIARRRPWRIASAALRQMTPRALKSAMPASEYPRPVKTSTVCWPRSGVGRMVGGCGAALMLMGLPTTFIAPRWGCCTRRAMPRGWTCGSANVCSMALIAPA